MPVNERKARDRTARHRLIVSTARRLAEDEGWGAVTTRRLAEQIEYSQPVLYSHFRGKDEIVTAVALDGFVQLGDELTEAVRTEPGPRALATTYLAFAQAHPAVYEAMFELTTDLQFADTETPAPLRDAFQVLLDTLGPLSGAVDPELFTEVFWAALHGLVGLTRSGRIPAQDTSRRIDVLVERFTGA
ncbi:TetR/AcrR family transcriptional regulator [Rhodococcus sp. O3]|uniref:TetR/AcrR family transcriptional regulator n=1 Tax=Rhodococcus sp. O3 TaxID=3404919 RepID=UPI003B673FA7